jgi:anthranilate phosphoribosyltransferase
MSGTDGLKLYLEILIAGERHLTADEAEAAFAHILEGAANEVFVASFLCLLRARRETSSELAGMVRSMNAACKTVTIPNNPKLLDIVGTGGDGADTINISTAAAVLAAACGCIVTKVGNRSASSACGAADVLEELGVVIDLEPNQVAECAQRVNIAFMFARVNHPVMQLVAPVRKQLGIRTCFNILGPLTNAAGAQHAVIGVFHPELLKLVAGALQEVGRVEHAVVIHGVGLDEISPLGKATIVEVKNVAPLGQPKVYTETRFQFDPESIGMPRCRLSDLQGGGPYENAFELRAVLAAGMVHNAKRHAVILNAGVGCYVYGLVDSIEAGCALARATLEYGKASSVLQEWITVSQEIAATVIPETLA